MITLHNDFGNKPSLEDLFWGTMIGLIACIAITCCTGCTTTKVVEVPVTHTEYIEKVDTFVKTDSIHETEYIKISGDTVYKEKVKYVQQKVYEPKYVEVIKRDSVPFPVEVIKEVQVERKASWVERALTAIGTLVLLVCFFLLLTYIFLRRRS